MGEITTMRTGSDGSIHRELIILRVYDWASGMHPTDNNFKQYFAVKNSFLVGYRHVSRQWRCKSVATYAKFKHEFSP